MASNLKAPAKRAAGKMAIRTQPEASISTERVTQSVRMRFNPLRGLTPERLSQYLEQFDLGLFRMAAITWDKIERRDYRLKVVAPKRKKAVARHGYDVLSVDKLEDSQLAMAEAQVQALKFFYDNLTATNAIRPDEQGGLSLLARQMMDAQGKYYAVHEIVFQPRPEGLTAQFVFCPLWWFEGTTGKLRYMDSEFQVYGRDMLPNEWLVTVGEGIMEACSVAWMFKNLSLQDWVAYCEKFGTPFIDAATSSTPGSDDWEALKDYVQDFGPDGGGVRSQSATINLIEPKAAGADPYKAMVENMDRALTILWRGGDLGTSSGKDQTGASLQGDEADILEGDDAVQIEETLSMQVSRAVIEWTFGPGTPVLAFLKFRQEQDPQAVSFQREVYKAFMQDGTVADVLANQSDLKKLTQDVGVPVNEEYVDPYLPVADANGQLVTGDLLRDSKGRVIGSMSQQTQSQGDLSPGDKKPSEVVNEDPGSDLGQSGTDHYARALAEDLQAVRERVAALLQISDDNILRQRAQDLVGEIERLKADILRLPKSAQALAEVQIAALFTGLTQGPSNAQLANGDVPGHEFHGNQYSEASAAAAQATKEARTNRNETTLRAAADAHRKAGELGSKEFHTRMADSLHQGADREKQFREQMATHDSTMKQLHEEMAKVGNQDLKAKAADLEKKIKTTKAANAKLEKKLI